MEQMKAKYSINMDFFNITSKILESWVWKCILKNRHQFRKGLCWKVGNGTKIHFCLDNWFANDNLATLLAIPNVFQIDTSFMVSQFISPAKEWDTLKLKELVDDVHLQLILATPIPPSSIPDSVCWGLLGTGDFTTKPATWAAHGIDPMTAPLLGV